MPIYNVEIQAKLGIQIEAKNEKEALDIGDTRLGEELEELNERILGPSGLWLTDTGKIIIEKADE